MLAFIGFALIICLLYLLASKRISVYMGLAVLPVLFALLAGFNPIEIADFAKAGVVKIAPTGVMLMFAILFFGVMFDAGLFDPIIRFVVRISAGDPLKIALGTAGVTALAQLDGSGSSTVLIVVSSLLPLYQKLGMRPVYLAIILGLTSGVMNILPWGGPTIRAAKALDIEVMELFYSMKPIIIVGLLATITVCFWLGRQERKRLGTIDLPVTDDTHTDNQPARMSKTQIYRFLANLALTIFVMSLLIYKPINILLPFIIGLPLALALNYPQVSAQQDRISAHAKAVVLTVAVIFSAGIFTGIVGGTGMIKAMATLTASHIPTGISEFLPLGLALLSAPLSIFFDPDSFYFGVLPLLAETGAAFNIPIDNMARAALIGQTTVGAFLSPLLGFAWLLSGMTGVGLSEIQKRGLLPALFVTTTMALTAWLMGLI